MAPHSLRILVFFNYFFLTEMTFSVHFFSENLKKILGSTSKEHTYISFKASSLNLCRVGLNTGIFIWPNPKACFIFIN